MKLDSDMPSFNSATQWFNQTGAAAVYETKGRPTLVHFWSISCEISEANLPHIAELRDERKRDGLRVIAVHLPRFEAETDTEAVRAAIASLQLTEPCAVDNEHKLSEAFSNTQGYVPAYYLFDVERKLKSFTAGERGIAVLENRLDRLLEDLRCRYRFCQECELFLEEEALFCSNCGSPLALPGSYRTHLHHQTQDPIVLPTQDLCEPDPLIGRVIEGKYELTGRLGEGGMSVVYRARRIHIGDEVAVKVLQREFVKEERGLERFRREASAAAMLNHPNVVTIHDFGQTPDRELPAYIVMEFVKGIPLREILNSEGRLATKRAVRLMRAICAGVGAAHRLGVVHRDLKPENIMILAPDDDEEFERVRVVDFGLAKLLDLAKAGVTRTGTVVGTPYYMSPEQCRGETLDARSDVYSLGAMLYEMVSGKRPFIAENISGIITKHLYEPPPPLPASVPVPRNVVAAIMRALAKEPEKRQKTASVLARELASEPPA
jgi:tRNA A-37 threonylcarbamoyl transferase component Bud32/thiol-disulfide isomerase/thioredoxin